MRDATSVSGNVGGGLVEPVVKAVRSGAGVDARLATRWAPSVIAGRRSVVQRLPGVVVADNAWVAVEPEPDPAVPAGQPDLPQETDSNATRWPATTAQRLPEPDAPDRAPEEVIANAVSWTAEGGFTPVATDPPGQTAGIEPEEAPKPHEPCVDLTDVHVLEDLAGRVYRFLRTTIRAELLIDRERAGVLADTR